MSKRPRHNILAYIYGGSVLIHVAVGIGAILLPKSTVQESVAIELHEAKKKAAPPKPVPPPPPPTPVVEKEKPRPAQAAAPSQAKVAPVAKAEAAPLPMGNDGFADLGVAMGNAEGPGVAVGGAAAAVAAAVATVAPAVTATHKVEQLAATHHETCTDPVVRPKRKIPVAPKYTLEARQAEIEGVVRVEVTIDETGHVVNARVVGGLGYGLDDSALTAARASTFEPATRCGKPVIGTIVLPFRFQQT